MREKYGVNTQVHLTISHLKLVYMSFRTYTRVHFILYETYLLRYILDLLFSDHQSDWRRQRSVCRNRSKLVSISDDCCAGNLERFSVLSLTLCIVLLQLMSFGQFCSEPAEHILSTHCCSSSYPYSMINLPTKLWLSGIFRFFPI